MSNGINIDEFLDNLQKHYITCENCNGFGKEIALYGKAVYRECKKCDGKGFTEVTPITYKRGE